VPDGESGRKKAEKAEKPSVADAASDAAQSETADIYLYNGPISDAGFAKIMSAVAPSNGASKAILLLTTYGGAADPAYRIARWFQRLYKELLILPTSICASAGTLVAIGAHRLIMSPFSELGPLDVQLQKSNELGERRSGLVIQSALEALRKSSFEAFEYYMTEIKKRSFGNVTFHLASEIATNVVTDLFQKIYEQIDPETIGQNERDLNVAVHYGRRLAKISRNISDENINVLVHNYPSHDFVIDMEETKQLFRNVAMPSEALTNLLLALDHRAFLTSAGQLDVSRLATYKTQEPQKPGTGDENVGDVGASEGQGNHGPKDVA
jgi:hypothetical protein